MLPVPKPGNKGRHSSRRGRSPACPQDPGLLQATANGEARRLHRHPLGPQGYPEALRTIFDPPALLYVRGQLPTGDSFAVVGARKASEPGCLLTTSICAELAARDIAIVSGLARGIDSAAHQGALRTGRTVAVLGCGIDRIYPRKQRPVSAHRRGRRHCVRISAWHTAVAWPFPWPQPHHQRPGQGRIGCRGGR
ncbi:MAG: DNA-processing protein DprA [Syntrophotaleaceae bacterium]